MHQKKARNLKWNTDNRFMAQKREIIHLQFGNILHP